jgi:hypothetical protein
MVNRPAIPKKIEKRIFQEAKSKCPFCGEDDVNTLVIHHIHAYSKGGNNEEDNLILVCSSCHSKISNGSISQAKVLATKEDLKRGIKSKNKEQINSGNVISLNQSTNTGVIANTINVNIRGSKSNRNVVLPGTIGSNRDYRNYVKYLIDRYHKFKKEEEKERMNYAIFYGVIKKKFGAKWDHIPESRFEDLVAYIQKRIDQTILGKVNKSRGGKMYSSYEEYIEKHAGTYQDDVKENKRQKHD